MRDVIGNGDDDTVMDFLRLHYNLYDFALLINIVSCLWKQQQKTVNGAIAGTTKGLEPTRFARIIARDDA